MALDLSLNLPNTAATDEADALASAIQKLINHECDAAIAAKAIDDAIVEDIKRSERPNPYGWLQDLWHILGQSAMQVPAAHSAQGRLIELLDELQRMPKHRVPQVSDGSVSHVELWSLNSGNDYEGLEQWLWELDQGRFTGHQQIERSKDAAILYLNFSAFLARLLAAGLVQTTRLSALIRPSPFGVRQPPADHVEKYEPYACAAAQWIIYAGDVLFEMCEKNTLFAIGKPKWTRTLWQSWKTKFDAITVKEEFSAESRALTSLAASRMREIENAGILSNVVEKFNPLPLQEERSDDE